VEDPTHAPNFHRTIRELKAAKHNAGLQAKLFAGAPKDAAGRCVPVIGAHAHHACDVCDAPAIQSLCIH